MAVPASPWVGCDAAGLGAPPATQRRLREREPITGTPTGDGNLFAGVVVGAADESFTQILRTPGVRIERIVSTGQRTPAGSWYDQDAPEWVLVVAGRARLLFDDEGSPRELGPGDYVLIPAHRRHRVTWTDPAAPTIWLAIHLPASAGPAPDAERED